MLHKVLGLSAAAVVVASLAYGGAHAATKQKSETPAPAPAAAACRTLTDEAACQARTDCGWVNASIDKKTNKQKRKAYCRTKPKSKAKSKSPT